MKTACATLALLAGSQAFMAPQLAATRSSTVTMSAAPESRREMLQTVFAAAAAAAVAAPQLAFADGAVSASTVQRAKGIYGSRVADLKAAVGKGDFAAVKAEKNAFTLLSTGGFAMSSKEDKKAAKALTKQIFAAVDKKDATALQAAYAKLIEIADLPPLADQGDQQGYSSDFDWKNRSTAGKGRIYIR